MEQILDQVDRQQGDYIYGGFWERFIAALIDGLITGAAQVGFSYFISGNFLSGADYSSSGVGLLMGLAYHTYFISSEKQATLGKQAMGLKVISIHGERLSPLNAAGRFFATYLSLFILLIGYIMAAFDSKKQALHDRLANTYVIRIK
ncbi:MAG: transporter [Cytophagaceae bacterium]|jgi:uncharacterized RDD family membrane protein YckC|nr:transporter [Cytophagaceae bacterium]